MSEEKYAKVASNEKEREFLKGAFALERAVGNLLGASAKISEERLNYWRAQFKYMREREIKGRAKVDWAFLPVDDEDRLPYAYALLEKIKEKGLMEKL